VKILPLGWRTVAFCDAGPRHDRALLVKVRIVFSDSGARAEKVKHYVDRG
jgi:hypothetical protein